MYIVHTFSSFIFFGHLSRCYGLQGKFFFRRRKDIIATVPRNAWLYKRGSFIPFYITAWESSQNKELISIEGINNRTEAELWKNTAVFGLKIEIKNYLKKERWIGWKIIDRNLGNIGWIKKIDHLDKQYCLTLQDCDKEIILPLPYYCLTKQSNGILETNLPDYYSYFLHSR